MTSVITSMKAPLLFPTPPLQQTSVSLRCSPRTPARHHQHRPRSQPELSSTLTNPAFDCQPACVSPATFITCCVDSCSCSSLSRPFDSLLRYRQHGSSCPGLYIAHALSHFDCAVHFDSCSGHVACTLALRLPSTFEFDCSIPFFCHKCFERRCAPHCTP